MQGNGEQQLCLVCDGSSLQPLPPHALPCSCVGPLRALQSLTEELARSTCYTPPSMTFVPWWLFSLFQILISSLLSLPVIFTLS